MIIYQSYYYYFLYYRIIIIINSNIVLLLLSLFSLQGQYGKYDLATTVSRMPNRTHHGSVELRLRKAHCSLLFVVVYCLLFICLLLFIVIVLSIVRATE